MDDELDDTITVPRRPATAPMVRSNLESSEPDLDDTVVPQRGTQPSPRESNPRQSNPLQPNPPQSTAPKSTASQSVPPQPNPPQSINPPRLVEPELKPRFEEPSGVELTATEPAPEDVSTRAYSLEDLQAAQTQQFYRFRIGKTVVWLDAVSYVGRRPSSPRIIYGQMPRLVRVPSPKQEVSSTHVELRQLGASVVLTDMKSTNGSVVFPPGGQPRKLRQGESIVATPGTLVDIGDGNVIEILPQEVRSRTELDATEGRQ